MAAFVCARSLVCFPVCSSKQQRHLCESSSCFVNLLPSRSNGRLMSTFRRNAASPDKTVSTQSSKQDGEGNQDILQKQADSSSSSSSSPAASDDLEQEQQQQERKQKEIRDALKELRSKNDSPNFWTGLLEEIGLIEWPDLGKVLGTTLVVLAVIFGSSVVLLTVNFLLAELSDVVFKVQSTQ